jgi:sugar phosphate isomerase/epimerase
MPNMTDSTLPRRHFLTTSAVAVAGALIGAAAAPGTAGARARSDAAPRRTPQASAFNLGVASYSLRNFPLDKALEMVQALRTPYVNFKSVHLPFETPPGGLAAFRAKVKAAGDYIVGGGTIDFSKDTDEDVQRLFEYARGAGMPLIVGTCMPPVVPRLEKFVKQYDIKVAIHNHGPEDTHFPSPYDVLAAVKGMDPRIGLCIDVGHTVRTGTDVVKAIIDAGPRVLDVHLKDLRDLKDNKTLCIVGEGAMPIAEIFQALDRVHFGGFANLEYEIDANDPLPGMKLSFAYMRGIRAGSGADARS